MSMLKLSNRITKFFTTLILSLIPFLLLAEQIETQISADTITVERGEVLFAEGNVLVQYGSNKIEAKALKFNQKTKEIKFTEIQDFQDGNAISLSASEAVISSDLSEGIISAASLILDKTIKIQTGEVRLKNGQISTVSEIFRATSCDECEGKEQNWYLSASSAQRDSENSNIVYKDVTVRVKGLPIAYIPYLRMPDPSVDRARGFLVPEAVLTSNLASGLKLPYFIPFGLSSDLLITPYFSSKTKTLEYRYRKKFKKGELTLSGALSDDDLVTNNLRYFSQLVGKYKLGYGIDLNFNVGTVGDSSYLGDYVYSEESEFNSEISLRKTIVEKQQFFDGDLSYLREKEQDNSLNEYYSLSGSYTKDISSGSLPGKLRLTANLNSSVNVNDDNSFSRPPSSAQVGINYNQRTFLGPLKFSKGVYGKYNSFVNSADAGTTNEEFSFQYGASTLISAPLYAKGKGKIKLLNPKLLLSFNGQENDILGDYFIGTEELNWGNIFSGKKIRSLTESETGLSVSIGMERQVFWENGRHLEVSFAASKIDNLTYTPSSNLGLEAGDLNYLGKFSYRTKNANSFSYNVLLSSMGRLVQGDLGGNYSHKKLNLDLNYETIDQAIDTRLSEDLRTVNFTSDYTFSDDFQVNAGGRYDLNNSKMATTSFGLRFDLGSWEYNFTQEYLKQDPEKFSMSAIFEDECTRLTFSFENRYKDIGSSEPVKALMFRVQLKPFANVVFSQGGDQITF
ncbi:hypothetical protein OAZ20_00280 [Paracoccaceae bacterium]|nr:hypothetical protein [Paracoccaceae bacterium]